jgi:hypothetical protein
MYPNRDDRAGPGAQESVIILLLPAIKCLRAAEHDLEGVDRPTTAGLTAKGFSGNYEVTSELPVIVDMLPE